MLQDDVQIEFSVESFELNFEMRCMGYVADLQTWL
jgi:hypothetical protein